MHPLRPFLGPFLASCGAIYGLLGANVWFLGAVLVSFSGFWGRCSFATFPFAVDRLSLLHLSMLLLGPGPCGLRAARLNNMNKQAIDVRSFSGIPRSV